MSGEEIKKQILFNNSQIAKLTEATMATFVLDPEINALINDNLHLQKICPHSFSNGVCIYCGIEEEEVND